MATATPFDDPSIVSTSPSSPRRNKSKQSKSALHVWEEDEAPKQRMKRHSRRDDVAADMSVYSSAEDSSYFSYGSSGASSMLDDLGASCSFAEALQFFDVGADLAEQPGSGGSSAGSPGRPKKIHVKTKRKGSSSRRRKKHSKSKTKKKPGPSSTLPGPQVPTPNEWSKAYRNDRELQVVKILVQNDEAREAYMLQVSEQSQSQKDSTSTATESGENTAEKNTEASDVECEHQKAATSTTDNMGEDESSSSPETFRLTLHDELLANQLRFYRKDAMLYYVEETVQPSSSSSVSSSDTLPSIRRIVVPQSLRRRLFRVALHYHQTVTDTNTGDVAAPFAVFHRLRSSYYWAGMRADVHQWYSDREESKRVLAALAEAEAAEAAGLTGTPTRASPSKEHRVTFNADEGDLNTTVDTCLDVTMDTDDGNDRVFTTPPASPSRMKSILRKATKGLSPSSSSPSSSPGLATVEGTRVASSSAFKAVSSNGSIASASPGRNNSPTNLSDTPTLIRKTSLISLLRSRSRDVNDDGTPSRRGLSLRLPTSPRKATPARVAAGLPPTSPASTISPLKKSDSFSKRVKGIRKKIAGNPKEGKNCTVTPICTGRVIQRVQDLQEEETVDEWRDATDGKGCTYYYNRRTRETRWKLPPNAIFVPREEKSGENMTTIDAEPRAPAAGIGQKTRPEEKAPSARYRSKTRPQENAGLDNDNVNASLFSMDGLMSASNQLVSCIDALAESFCKNDTVDALAESFLKDGFASEAQVWQEPVPSVIGVDSAKHA